MNIIGQTIRCKDPLKEALEIVGVDNLIISNSNFIGGKCCLRLNGCNNFTIDNVLCSGMMGPANPDGQGIQLINSWGKMNNISIVASKQAEDLISVYADRTVAGNVDINNVHLYGRGDSDSSTSICLDGPHCPTTTIKNISITRARCGITIGGGVGHVIYCDERSFKWCQSMIYVNQFYDGPFGNNTIHCPSDNYVLLGEKAGSTNKILR